MAFKSKIMDVKDTIPLDKEGYLPGALIQQTVEGKPTGAPMRVIQVSGQQVLVNYLGE